MVESMWLEGGPSLRVCVQCMAEARRVHNAKSRCVSKRLGMEKEPWQGVSDEVSIKTGYKIKIKSIGYSLYKL